MTAGVAAAAEVHAPVSAAVYPPSAPFGTILGVTHGGVEVYSSDYDSLDKAVMKEVWSGRDRTSFESAVNGESMGFKWQCVELARRYMFVNQGCVFNSVPMAFDIFRMRSVRRVKDNQLVSFTAHPNGSTTAPTVHAVLIWAAGGEFERTGHVAIVIAVGDDHVDIAEQNVEDAIWPDGRGYSRRLGLTRDADGGAHLSCTYSDTRILGWMSVQADQPYIYEEYPNCPLTPDCLKRCSVHLSPEQSALTWLDPSVPYLKAFEKVFGARLCDPSTPDTYYTMSTECNTALEYATNELHKLFLDATDYVLGHKSEFVKYFGIPEKLWPKLRRSWYSPKRQDVVSGRFDFTVTKEQGIKVYEYNADSASCLLECGTTQDRWCNAAGVGNVGTSPSLGLYDQLVATWKAKGVQGPLHMMCDNDDEELYHTLYMKAAAEEAGITTVLHVGLNGISWRPDANLQDSNGLLIKNIWKTWSWRTAINQLSADEDFADTEEDFDASVDMSRPPRLVDVLLHWRIRVFEPLWTVLPSSKAILPVLWRLRPGHPYLLRSSFTLGGASEFAANGYVAKPVTGRAGGSIALFDGKGSLIEKSSGRWDKDDMVYQELAKLPQLGGAHVQLCTWAVNGAFAGTVIRVDSSSIINMESGCFPLRIV